MKIQLVSSKSQEDQVWRLVYATSQIKQWCLKFIQILEQVQTIPYLDFYYQVSRIITKFIEFMYDLDHLSKYLIDNQGVKKYTILYRRVLKVS